MSDGEGALDQYWAALKDTYQQKYPEVAADHMVFPRNTGEIIEHNAFGIISDERDEIMSIWLNVENDIITNSSFATEECVTCTACGSVLTELIRGKTLADALLITPDAVMTDLGGLSEEYRNCAELVVSVLHAAAQDYKDRASQSG